MAQNRALAPVEPGGIGIWNGEEVALLKEVIAKGATDAELLLFSKVCERRQLDPFARQIYCVKRDGKVTFQTGIDGFRSIADRTAAYAGNDEYLFDEGLTEYQHIRAGRGNPETATSTVYKLVKGVRCEFTATARWDEYYPGDKLGFMWRKMPYLMLGKCAESQALRRAFPEQLGGIYTDDEMAQADRGHEIEANARMMAAPTIEPIGTGPLHPLGRKRAAEVYRRVTSQTDYTERDIGAWLQMHGFDGAGNLPDITEQQADAMARDAVAGRRPWQEVPTEAVFSDDELQEMASMTFAGDAEEPDGAA